MRRLGLLLAGILFPLITTATSAQTRVETNAQLQRRISILEKQIKALVRSDKSMNSNLDEIEEDVDELQKTLPEHLFNGGKPSVWDSKVRVFRGGPLEYFDCRMTFTPTSSTAGTVSMSPFGCPLPPSNWPAPATVTASYLVLDNAIFFQNLQDDVNSGQNGSSFLIDAAMIATDQFDLKLAGSGVVAVQTRRR